MEFRVLGGIDGGPSIALDHERFSYAGKFRMTNTGKAVAEADDEIIAALSFSRDRTTESVIWIRYVSVAANRRGNGVGSRLCAFVAEELLGGDTNQIRIAVNNPFAFHALYKAGFTYTGTQTGLAEVVLAKPVVEAEYKYQDGLDVFRDRAGLSDEEQQFLAEKEGLEPPFRLIPEEVPGLITTFLRLSSANSSVEESWENGRIQTRGPRTVQ